MSYESSHEITASGHIRTIHTYAFHLIKQDVCLGDKINIFVLIKQEVLRK